MDGSNKPETAGKGLAGSAGALAGLKVIDLTRVLGGPYATMILADHGAEVTKIEPPQGDEVRDWGPPFGIWTARATPATSSVSTATNARSALDVARPEGRAVLLRLLEDADILVENFKPGGMEKWGLGYEKDLAPRFPRLIHCRVSGFGGDGPLGGLPGYDAILQAMTGLMSVNGDPTTGPLRLGIPLVDLGTGLYSVIGILMALHERARSGRGQYLDMTLHDCGMALLHPQAANFFLNGKRPMPTGNPHPNLAPYEKYPTRTGEIFVASGNDGQFRKLCELIGRPELSADAAVPRQRRPPLQPCRADRAARRRVRPRGRARAVAPPDPQRRASRAGAAGRRGDAGAAHRAPRDGDGTRRIPRPRHADQAVAHPGRHPRAPLPASASMARRCWPSTATRRSRSRSWNPTACSTRGAGRSYSASSGPSASRRRRRKLRTLNGSIPR